MHFATMYTYVPYFQRKVHTDKCFKSSGWKLTFREVSQSRGFGENKQGTAEENHEG